jgi:NitT/TauT family transport system permease protein
VVLAVRWATILATLIGWQVVCDGPLAGSGYLTGPVDVVRDGLPAVLSGTPLQELGHTTFRFLIAFVITAVLGTVLGLVAGRLQQQLFAGVRDVVSVVYALPMVPFYPLFVLWLGLGARSEIAFGVIHGVVPVILLVMTASAGIPANYTASSRAMGAGPVRRLWSITLPAVVPDAVSAVKIGAALTLLGVLLAELMISVNGVGSFIAARVTSQSAAQLDAMVLVVCVGALVVNAALTAAERRVSAWRSTLG